MAKLTSAGIDAQSTAKTDALPAVPGGAEQLPGRVTVLIQQLGDPSYLVRQSAQNELGRIGPEAFDALSAAENDTDVEISSRAKYLVQQIRAQWIHTSDSPQVRRILDKYELLDDSARLQALRQLAFLPGDLGLAPLCRLIRFERSPLVSKYSALLVIGQPDAVARSWPAKQKTIEANLAQNNGPGAQWLRTYVRFQNDPQSAKADVDKLVNAELAGLAPFANDAVRKNTLELEALLVNVLKQNFQRPDRATDVLQQLLSLGTNDPDAVAKLADLLVQHQAWDLVDQLARRAEATFNVDPALLYTWAHALRAEGKTDAADKISDKAFKLIGNSLEDHKTIGTKLQRLGLFDAAEREYQHVIKTSPQDTELTIETQARFGEMLHDQDLDLQAAQVVKKLIDAMDKDPTVLQRTKEFGGDTYPDTMRGQMHLYYACSYAGENKPDERRRELDEGAKYDPTNADILIGLYETSVDNPARRKQAMDLIHVADKGFREAIAQQPTTSIPYNMDAWLIGNTEGDFDLAIQYSQNSLELLKNQPEELQINEPGFLDTLAHCYAGKRDFRNAVKFQARAAELDPHTMQIARALKQFKQQLDQ
ncbi:MAG TPA: hypothetical protein VGJ04_04235 [Pirellulales bacterium]